MSSSEVDAAAHQFSLNSLFELLEYHPADQAKRLAQRDHQTRVASLKSSPVQTRFAPLAAASGLPLAWCSYAPC